MRKLYLFLACLAAFSAQAVSLKVYMGDKEITPGSTAYFSDYQAEEYESGVWDIKMDPKLYVESDFTTNNVSVTAVCTSGHNIQMCAGTNCQIGETVVKDNLTLRKGQKFALEFEYMNMEYEGATVPDVVTKFTVTGADSGPIEFTVVMGPSAALVSRVEMSDEIRLTSAGIEYGLTSAKDFALYTVDGICVMKASLEGNGLLPTNGLVKGVYLYTLDGHSGKIFVK